MASIPDHGIEPLDGDTYVSPGSGRAALRSVGGACVAVDAVMEEKQAGGLYRSASDLYATEYGRESLDRLRSAPFQHSRDGNQGVFLAPNGEPRIDRPGNRREQRIPPWPGSLFIFDETRCLC